MKLTAANLRRALTHWAWPYTEKRSPEGQRFWIADGDHVRLSLPWHGPASWADLHAYVRAVIDENTIPHPDYVPRREAQADRLARSILLSVCHRLKIEPVGAFDPYQEDRTDD